MRKCQRTGAPRAEQPMADAPDRFVPLPDDALSGILAHLVHAGTPLLRRLACTSQALGHLVASDAAACQELVVSKLWHAREYEKAVEKLLQLVLVLNPHIKEAATVKRIENAAKFDEAGELLSLDLGSCGLRQLPCSFAVIHVVEELNLSYNQFTCLPESFGDIRVGGSLYLCGSELDGLPESFGDIWVGEHLWLWNNRLSSLPESFGNLMLGKDLWLSHNQLTSLPESFGYITVGGDLIMRINQLTSLPESIGCITVGGDLILSDNRLTSLPESFGGVTVAGDLSLRNNSLTSLPESIGYLTVHGNLDLSHNQLNSLLTTGRPVSFADLRVGGNLWL